MENQKLLIRLQRISLLLLVRACTGRYVDGIYCMIAWCVWWRDTDRASPKRLRNIGWKKGNEGQRLGLDMDIQGYVTTAYTGFGSHTCPLRKARASDKDGLSRMLPPRWHNWSYLFSLMIWCYHLRARCTGPLGGPCWPMWSLPTCDTSSINNQ
jgi:hypothetical protein